MMHFFCAPTRVRQQTRVRTRRVIVVINFRREAVRKVTPRTASMKKSSSFLKKFPFPSWLRALEQDKLSPLQCHILCVRTCWRRQTVIVCARASEHDQPSSQLWRNLNRLDRGRQHSLSVWGVLQQFQKSLENTLQNFWKGPWLKRARDKSRLLHEGKWRTIYRVFADITRSFEKKKLREITYSSCAWSLSTAARASRAFLVSGDGERAEGNMAKHLYRHAVFACKQRE